MNVRNCVIEKTEKMSDEIISFVMELIRSEPVNPAYDIQGGRSEFLCSKILQNKLSEFGIAYETFDIDLEQLAPYKGKPGYIEGFTDQFDYSDRPNIVAYYPGTSPVEGRSILLAGHLDVVAADNLSNWDFPPFEPVIVDDVLHGRGSVDMLAGTAVLVMALKVLKECGIKLKGDVCFSGIVSEESGGTGALMVAENLRRKGMIFDAGIMGEPTNLNINLLCRGIQKVDVTVRGRTGHLEEPQPHWQEGGAVDAIQKARYILSAIDELNRDWSLRKDKIHPLLPIPNEIKLSMIEGGHQRSSYPEKCVLSFNIQVFPHESNKDGLGINTRKEFELFLNKVFDVDPWLSIHRPEINWISQSDCSEVSPDHPFVAIMESSSAYLGIPTRRGASGFHTDTGWFNRLTNTSMINFGPGNPSLAHRDNEQCPVPQIINAVKVIALALIEWCKINYELLP